MRSLIFIMLLFVLSVFPLNAQEAGKTDNTGNTQSQEQSLEGHETQTDKDEIKDEYSLDELVVRERRVKSIEIAVPTTEITAEDIEIRSDKVLKDVLYQVPGIQVSMQRKGTTQFHMRGYDMSKIAILVDDIPLIDTYGGGMDIDNIGLMDISEIIISRGTTSALYGTRGGVGSINLIKKEPADIYTNVSAEFGQHGNFVTSVSRGASKGNFYYYISALYDRSDGYTISKKLDRKEREKWLLRLSRYDLYNLTLDSIYDHPNASAAVLYLNDTGVWDHVSHEKYKLNGKTGYHFTPELEMGASFFYNDTEKKNSNYFTDMRSMYAYNEALDEKAWKRPDTTYILRNLSSLWPEYNDYAVSPYLIYEKGKFRVKANAYFYENTNTFLAYDDPNEHKLAYNRDADNMTWSIWTSRTYGFNMYPSWELSSWNRLNLAFTYYATGHKEEDEAYNEYSTETIEEFGTGRYEMMNIDAGYLTFAVEDEMHIMENTDLSLGVSYDGQDLRQYQIKSGVYGSTQMVDQYQAEDDSLLWGTRDSFNPVADIVYEPIKDFLKFRAAASRKTSFPTLQAYSNTVSPYQESSDLGSRDVMIKPEKMLNANLGFELSFFESHVIWGADYFYSQYDDKITKVYITKIDDYIYRNIDAAVIHGAETTFNLNFQDVLDITDVTLSSTYTYMFSENQTDVDDSFLNKGNKFENLPEHKFTFDFRSHFKTDTSLIIFGNFEFNQIQYTMKSIPRTEADFSTWYFYAQKLHDPIKIDMKVSQKISDNYEAYVMCKNILDDYNADPFNPGPGRMFYAGLKASF
ncbi:MAG: TonB-dependent receptor plug domain-containing protein [Deltaproteobacteria bacterium]|nr:TonB-dependent receptor plug domain-containing protein [Deltaproteobacteria bacterium]